MDAVSDGSVEADLGMLGVPRQAATVTDAR